MIIKKRKITEPYNRQKVYTTMQEVPDFIYAGAYLDSNGFVNFDWTTDKYKRDIVALTSKKQGTFNREDVRYVYGYEYLDKATAREIKQFRQYVKNLGMGYDLWNENPDHDVEEFIERAIFNFDRIYDLKSFGATVHIESTKQNSVVSYMAGVIADIADNAQIGFKLIKKMYSDVTFNMQKAFEVMKSSGKYASDNEIYDFLNAAQNRFESLKKSNRLFEMKKFVPRELREGFENYLEFKTPQEKWVYEQLQGIDVLIFDDFLTSGATVKEIIRYLKSINDNNTLTVFVLVKQ